MTSAQHTLESVASLAGTSAGKQARGADTPCSSPADCKLKSAVANRLCGRAPPRPVSDVHNVATFFALLPCTGATMEEKRCRHPTSLATLWFDSCAFRSKAPPSTFPS